MKKQCFLAGLAGILVICMVPAASASVILNNARSSGNQSGWDLGMDFTVNSAVTVSALGTFDPNISGLPDPVTTAQIAASLGPNFWSSGVPINIYVGIFNVATGLEVSPTAIFNADGASSYYAIAGSIFENITPFILGPGTYSIVASGYTAGFQNGITARGSPDPVFDTLLGALTLLPNGARSNGSDKNGAEPFGFPTQFTGNPEFGGNPSFLAGTFIATNAVPDAASTLALLGLAMAGLHGLRKKLNR